MRGLHGAAYDCWRHHANECSLVGEGVGGDGNSCAEGRAGGTM